MQHRLLLVNYHYVRDPNVYSYPGIHPIAPPAFARQLQRLAAEFHMATPEEVEEFAIAGRELPKSSVLITFDDGLVDHAEAARTVLDPMGIKAVFFVCSRPLTEQRALVVHKIHWLRATTSPDRFRTDFLAELPDEWRERRLSGAELKAAQRTYIYDRPQDAEIKYLLNFILPEEMVDQATSAMLERRDVSESEFCRNTYMGAPDLRALAASGHRIGAHTHDHRPVMRLGTEEDELMAINIKSLEATTGHKPTWISYPYGRDWALPRDPNAFCRRHGFTIGVTLEGTWVRPEHAPFALDRINTNEVDKILSERNVAAF